MTTETNIMQTWDEAVRLGRFIVVYGGSLHGERVAVSHSIPLDDESKPFALHEDGDVRAAFAFGVLRSARPYSRQRGVVC